MLRRHAVRPQRSRVVGLAPTKGHDPADPETVGGLRKGSDSVSKDEPASIPGPDALAGANGHPDGAAGVSPRPPAQADALARGSSPLLPPQGPRQGESGVSVIRVHAFGPVPSDTALSTEALESQDPSHGWTSRTFGRALSS